MSLRQSQALHSARAWYAEPIPHTKRTWHNNLHTNDTKKAWQQLQHKGIAVTRCTVEHLIHRLGLRGATPSKTIKTTMIDSRVSCPLEGVNRQFLADQHATQTYFVLDAPEQALYARQLQANGALIQHSSLD